MKNNYVKTLEEALLLWPKQDIGQAKDFTNQKINKWTVLYRTSNLNKQTRWVGKCECGNFGILRAGQWSKQCADCQIQTQQKDYTNTRFGFLTVLNEKKRQNNRTFLKCQCDCGNIVWVNMGNLTSGHTKSCGCMALNIQSRLQDLTGETYGDLIVLGLSHKKNNQRYWKCKCTCGNETTVSTHDLKSGNTKSCGCKRRAEIHIGDRFGKLIVKSIVENERRNGHILYNCDCDCGTKNHKVTGTRLLNGEIKSCGCGRTISYNEENIANLLKKLKIPFIRNYSNEKLNQIYLTHGRHLEYDFYINNSYIIEYDGQQHFYARGTGWDTEEHLQNTRKRDLIKNKFCFENNIPLIRIPYDEEYTIDDLILETTRFLLTPKNEREYYDKRRTKPRYSFTD